MFPRCLQNGPENLTIGQECSDKASGIVISSPDGVETENRPDFSLEQDDVYEFLDLALKKYSFRLIGDAKSPRMPARRIVATLVGRLDGPDKLVSKDSKGRTIVRRGYGNMGELHLRLVLKSVESVAISK